MRYGPGIPGEPISVELGAEMLTSEQKQAVSALVPLHKKLEDAKQAVEHAKGLTRESLSRIQRILVSEKAFAKSKEKGINSAAARLNAVAGEVKTAVEKAQSLGVEKPLSVVTEIDGGLSADQAGDLQSAMVGSISSASAEAAPGIVEPEPEITLGPIAQQSPATPSAVEPEIHLGPEEPVADKPGDPFGVSGPHRPAHLDDFSGRAVPPVSPRRPAEVREPGDAPEPFAPVTVEPGDLTPPKNPSDDILDVNIEPETPPLVSEEPPARSPLEDLFKDTPKQEEPPIPGPVLAEQQPSPAPKPSDNLIISDGKITQEGVQLADVSEHKGFEAYKNLSEQVVATEGDINEVLSPEVVDRLEELHPKVQDGTATQEERDEHSKNLSESIKALIKWQSENKSSSSPKQPDAAFPPGAPKFGPNGEPLTYGGAPDLGKTEAKLPAPGVPKPPVVPGTPKTPAAPLTPEAKTKADKEKSKTEKEADEASKKIEEALEKIPAGSREAVRKALETRNTEAERIKERYGNQKFGWNRAKKWFGDSAAGRFLGGALKTAQGFAEVFASGALAGPAGVAFGPALFAHGSMREIEGAVQMVMAIKEGVFDKNYKEMKRAGSEIDKRTKDLEKAINEYKQGDAEKIAEIAKEIRVLEAKRLESRAGVLSWRAKSNLGGIIGGVGASVTRSLIGGLPTGFQNFGGALPHLAGGHNTALALTKDWAAGGLLKGWGGGWMFGYNAGEVGAGGAHALPVGLGGVAGHGMGAATTTLGVKAALCSGLALAGAAIYFQSKHNKEGMIAFEKEAKELREQAAIINDENTKAEEPVVTTASAPSSPGSPVSPAAPGSPKPPVTPKSPVTQEQGPKSEPKEVVPGDGKPPKEPKVEKKEEPKSTIATGSSYEISNIKPLELSKYAEIRGTKEGDKAPVGERYEGMVNGKKVIIKFNGEAPKGDKLNALVEKIHMYQPISREKGAGHPMEIEVKVRDGKEDPKEVVEEKEKPKPKESKFEAGREYSAKIIARDTKRRGRFTALVDGVKVDHLLITNFDKRVDKIKIGDEIQIIANDAGDPKKDGLTLGAKIKRIEPKLKTEKEKVDALVNAGTLWKGIADEPITVSKVDYAKNEQGVISGEEQLSLKDKELVIRRVLERKVKFSLRDGHGYNKSSGYEMDLVDFLNVADPAYFSNPDNAEKIDELRAAKGELVEEILGKEKPNDEEPPAGEEPPEDEDPQNDIFVEKQDGKEFKIKERVASTGKVIVEPVGGGDEETLEPEEFEARFEQKKPEVVEVPEETPFEIKLDSGTVVKFEKGKTLVFPDKSKEVIVSSKDSPEGLVDKVDIKLESGVTRRLDKADLKTAFESNVMSLE